MFHSGAQVVEVQWLPGTCFLLTITGAQDAKEDYANTFLVSTLSYLLTSHWQSKLHDHFQHPCGGAIFLVHCSERSRDRWRRNSLYLRKPQGSWVVVRTYLAASWNMEVQRTCSKKTGGELALIRSCVILMPEHKLVSLFPPRCTILFLYSFFSLLPRNLQLGLSHGDANQTRNGVGLATAAGVGLSIQRAGFLLHEQQGHGRGSQRMRPQCPAFYNTDM